MTVKDLYINEKQKPFFSQSQSYLRKTALSVRVVNNGIILPAASGTTVLWAIGGVLDEYGEFVDESKNDSLFGGKYPYDKTKVEYIDEEVIFFGPFVKHWGHFICDQINRLWFIKNNPTKYKIAYCGWNWNFDNGDMEGNFLRLLELLGCKKDQLINIQQPTKFKKIIIPERAFVGGQFYSPEFEKTIDIIVKNALKKQISVPQKIYLSRTKFAKNKERGEEKIEKQFKANGYTILYPEKMSLDEQIAYFNKAEKIAMVSGSISHNLMFTQSSSVEAAIINKFDLENKYQLVVDDLSKAKISYIDCYIKLREVCFGLGPFLLTPTNHLKQYFQKNGYSFLKSCKLSLYDLIWYYTTYHKIYSAPINKKYLEEEKKAIEIERQNMKPGNKTTS